MPSRILMAVLLCCAPVATAVAQRLSGTVAVAGTSLIPRGVVVTVADSAGRTLARTLTDDRGRYSLQLPPGSRYVRATRIGFRPGTAPIAPAGADATIDLTLVRTPVLLQTVRVSADGSCGKSPDAQIVLQVWEHARAALLSSVVAREAKPARVSLLRFERRIEPARHLITDQDLTIVSGTSTTPVMAARSAAQLALNGYSTGAAADRMFFAPDADVLLDESFSATHCFGLTYDRGRSGQVGLTFAPRRRPAHTQAEVRGTLWIDPQTPELVQIDYRYTNVEPEMESAGAGGSMHFRTMANGVVLIDSWSILLPRMSEVTRRGVGGRPVTRAVVSELSETGGYVLSGEWADGTKWRDAVGALRGQIQDSKTGLGVAGADVAVSGAAATSDSTGHFVLGPIPPGRYRLSITDSAFTGFVRPRQQTRDVVVTYGDTVTANFEVTSRETLLGDLCRGQKRPGNTYVLLGRISDGADRTPDKLQVEAHWFANVAGAAALDLNALSRNVEQTSVNENGRFVICGVPRQSSHVTLQAAIANAALADTSIPSASTVHPPIGGTRQIDWALPAGTFEGIRKGHGSVLSGRVLRNGNPVPEAQVWVVLADTMVTTDSAGRFRVGGLRAGPQIIQVRRMGYAVKRDTVSLRPAQETMRDFAMDGVQELDTVRTLGAARKYDNPKLQDFERRRLSGQGGYFISEDALRQLEQISLPSIIRGNIVGANIETLNGRQFLKSRTSGNLANDGGGPCYSSVFLDGLVIYDGVTVGKDAPPDLASFMAIGLSGIEYYRGGASLPLEFRSRRNDCGTLLLWTRGK